MKTRKIFALALALLMTAALLAGCSVNRDEDEPSPLGMGNEDNVNDRGDDNQQGGEVEKPKFEGINSAAKYQYELGLVPGQFEGKTLTIWTFWNMSDVETENIRAFEEITGCKVEYVNKLWEMYDSDLTKGIATGEGPDICYFMGSAIPAWVMKGYLTPVSDYIDFSKITIPLGEGTMNYYTFNGKLYTVPDFHEGSSKMYFRKDIFANASLPTPYDLYKEGQWTWDAFVDLGQRVKEANLNSNGEYDVWGYYSWQQEQILYSNGANHIQWVDGRPVEGLSDPKAIQALEWERALSEQYDIYAPYDPDLDPPGMLVSGKIAMMYWGAWLITSESGDGLRELLGDKLGFAPFPRGPGADKDLNDVASGHREGISGAAKEPELAALFMLFKRLPADEDAEAAKAVKDQAERIRVYGSLEEYELAAEMDRHSTWYAVDGFTGLESVVTTIRNKEDMTAAQAVEAYKGVAQNYIDMTWNP